MIKSFKKHSRYILSVVLIVVIMGAGLAAYAANTSIASTADTPDKAVQMYLESVSGNDFDGLSKHLSLGISGMDPAWENDSTVSSTQVTVNNSFPQRNTDIVTILKQQKEYVQALFGQNSWDNITYTMEKINSPEVKEQWIEKATGKVITEQEGIKLNQEFWDSIGAKEGVNSSEIFGFSNCSGEITDSKKLKSIELKKKYKNSEPAELQLVPAYNFYIVHFKFNGQERAPSGESNFNIQISNKSGKWALYNGLQWHLPEKEPQGDI